VGGFSFGGAAFGSFNLESQVFKSEIMVQSNSFRTNYLERFEC
jgi:hypothetical protein